MSGLSQGKALKSKPVTLLFELDVEELDVGEWWPPITIEGLLFTETKRGYRLLVAPCFVKSLSVGDVIEVDIDRDGKVLNWQHVEQSNRSTIWLWTSPGCTGIEEALNCLKNGLCNVERFVQFNYFSVDLPPSFSLNEFDNCMSRVPTEKILIEYPSLRHEDTD